MELYNFMRVIERQSGNFMRVFSVRLYNFMKGSRNWR